ncbi:uncharacterized protein LOC110953844 [Acanthochromis polyacanthus]|uniref:uncharacterized protein LOC110953844 n=1 Tax=Acanthochromis polyacanthus TaxID=80966 RepID=UPI000B909E64|nr:uncharacterized protein LOC110953844 [Acanthochromis polyacanthus]
MQRSAQGANTLSKKTRQQNTRCRPANNRQDTTMGPINGPVRPLAWAPMTTEYQEKFLPPQWKTKTIVTTSRIKDPYHPLRGTNADIGTLRSSFKVQNCRKIPPQPPQLSEPPKDCRRRVTSITCPSMRTIVPWMPPKQNFVSSYQSDFQPWVVNKLKPYRPKDNFSIKSGIVALDEPHEQEKRSTANSTDVPQEVSHSVHPRPNQVQPLQLAAASFQPKAASHINREHLDESSDFFDRFQSLSLETKFCGQPKKPGQPEDHRFDQMMHKSQGTKPILPSVQTSKNNVEPAHGNTMKEDLRAWSAPRVTKKPRSGFPKLNNAAGSNSSCNKQISEPPRSRHCSDS